MDWQDPIDRDEEEFLRRHLDTVRWQIASQLEHLRTRHPKEWAEFARELQRRGPYGRIEQINEQAEAHTAAIESMLGFIRKHIRTILTAELEAIEHHFVEHGQQLDDLLRHPASDPPPSKVVDDFLRDIGMGWRPKSDP